MCGRFSLTHPIEEPSWRSILKLLIQLEPRYNIAPSQQVSAIGFGPEALRLRWGLWPRWAKNPGKPMSNAQAETIREKPSFSDSFELRRCLIPADGFYEWKQIGKKKHPFHIRLKSRQPFCFAGVWDAWQGNDSVVKSCAMLTTVPNEITRPIHDRMPVILTPESAKHWLDPEFPTSKLDQFMVPYPADLMEAVEVNDYVNKAGNEGPKCQEPPYIEPMLF